MLDVTIVNYLPVICYNNNIGNKYVLIEKSYTRLIKLLKISLVVNRKVCDSSIVEYSSNNKIPCYNII